MKLMVCIYGPPKFRPIKIRRSTRRKSTSISECSRTEFWQSIIRNHILLRKKSKILRTFRRKLLTGACSKSIFSEINKSRIWAESFRNIFDQNMVRKNHNVTWSIFIKSGSSRTDDSSTSKIDTADLFSDNLFLAVIHRGTRDTRTEKLVRAVCQSISRFSSGWFKIEGNRNPWKWTRKRFSIRCSNFNFHLEILLV